MELVVKLVTVIDVVAVDAAGNTSTFKLAENPILKNIKVGDLLYLDGTELTIKKNTSIEQLANKVTESQRKSPRGGTGCAAMARDLRHM